MKVYTAEKVAEFACCGKQTIYRQLNDEETKAKLFPNAFIIGRRRWMIPRDDVIAYLQFDPEEETLEIVS